MKLAEGSQVVAVCRAEPEDEEPEEPTEALTGELTAETAEEETGGTLEGMETGNVSEPADASGETPEETV